MDNSAPEDFADASEHETILNKLTNKDTKGRCQWFKDFCIIITEGSYLHTCTHILPIKAEEAGTWGAELKYEDGFPADYSDDMDDLEW